jgi:putative phosphoesterase
VRGRERHAPLNPGRRPTTRRTLKIGVVSDTHLPRFGERLPAALERGLRRERVTLILHLGDFTGRKVPRLLEEMAPLEAVAGNNDPAALVRRFGRRRILTLGGVRVGMVHGDGAHGTTIDRSVAAFADEPVDVICFGHSHQPVCERRGATWLVNPGSPTDKRRQASYSYAILSIARGRVLPRLVFFGSPGRRPTAGRPTARRPSPRPSPRGERARAR